MKRLEVLSINCSSLNNDTILGEVGRYRMNKKLGLDVDIEQQVLTKEDIITIVRI